MSRRDAEGTTSPQKLLDFSVKLQNARGTTCTALEAEKSVNTKESGGLGLAWRVSLELVAAIAVGGGLGWFLDSGFGTKPLFMVVFLVLGGVAGTLNVYRISQGLDETVGLGQAKRRRGKRAAEGPP